MMVPQKIKNSDGVQSINRSEQVLNQEKLGNQKILILF